MDIIRYLIKDRAHGWKSVGLTRLNKIKQVSSVYSEAFLKLCIG